MVAVLVLVVTMLGWMLSPAAHSSQPQAREKDIPMSPTAVHIATAELCQRVKQYRFRVPDMPREAGQGYPVPVYRENHMWLAVPFFTSSGAPRQPRTLFAPRWLILIEAERGEDIRVRRPDAKNEP